MGRAIRGYKELSIATKQNPAIRADGRSIGSDPDTSPYEINRSGEWMRVAVRIKDNDLAPRADSSVDLDVDVFRAAFLAKVADSELRIRANSVGIKANGDRH